MDDDGLVLRVPVALGVEVPELVDPGEGHVLVGVVHHRGALEVAGRLHGQLEVDGPPRELARGVAEVRVDRAGVDDRDLADVLVAHVEEVGLEAHLDLRVVDHPLQPRGVAVDRQALVGVVEVAVVEVVADREPADDVGRQLRWVGLPLLRGVAADERLVERAADQRDPLLLEVRRGGGVDLARLLGDQRARLVGRHGLAEVLADRGQVDRHRVDAALVVGEHPVLVAGELREPVDVLPHALVGGVEQVSAVLVDLDPGLRLGRGVRVTTDVVASVEDKDVQSQVVGTAFGDGESEQTGADDDEISVHRHSCFGAGQV